MAMTEIGMEEQHPIPQQISSYQFRLVGDMTLKQFMQIAGGVLVSILMYSSSINPVVKWPVMIVSFLFGIALAFFPIQDRPLEKWIFAFFKSIYSPTLFQWKKIDPNTRYFIPDEQFTVNEFNQLIKQPATPTPPPLKVPIDEEHPAVKEEIENIKALTSLEEKEKEMLTDIELHLEGSTPATVEPITQTKEEVEIPETQKIEIETQKVEDQELDSGTEPTNTNVDDITSTVSTVFDADSQHGLQKLAEHSSDISLPSTPTQPNILVGQVLDTEGKIVEAAILEIKDLEGRPARAVKTNKLGHFLIVTPLANGKYQIITEKEGLVFEQVTLDVTGEIIPPVIIRAKAVGITNTEQIPINQPYVPSA